MSLNSIRRAIVYQAGGRNKLGWFSWAAAIFGASVLLIAAAAVAFQFVSSW